MTTTKTKRYVREDGRLLDTLREQTSVLNTITRSTSSCEWHSDETKVVCSIQGPRELQFSSLSQSKEDGERLVVESYCKLLPSKNDDEDDGSSFDDPLKEEKEKERTTEQFVKSCAKAAIELEKNASFGLIVSVQELKNDGSFLSCALNAVGLALILSGVETKGWMCSSTACLMKVDDEKEEYALVLDPTREEEAKAKATITCAFLINEETEDKTILLGTKMRGKMTETEVFECVALCRDAATSVCTYFDRVLTLREREFEERYQITDKNVEKWKKMMMEMAKEAV
jgi:ribonuclease PH